MTVKPDVQIFWVVGDNTNVGKTTVTAALIRTLNGLNHKTIGFKPYAGARLMDVVDLLEEIVVGDQMLVGRDARKLAQASPLTPPSCLELINPSWRVTHPSRDNSVMIRKGSLAIGQRRFFQTRSTVDLVQRDDFLRLNAHIGLPVESMFMLESQPADSLDFLDQRIQVQSFEQLVALGPEVMVCEGAGRLLPYWRGSPAVRHIFLITNGDLLLFPNVNLVISQAERSPLTSAPTVSAIMQNLKGRKHIRKTIPVFRPSELDHKMDEFVSGFAQACI